MLLRCHSTDGINVDRCLTKPRCLKAHDVNIHDMHMTPCTSKISEFPSEYARTRLIRGFDRSSALYDRLYLRKGS